MEDSLFLDRVRFSHLRTEAPIQAEAQNPRPLPVMHLQIARLAFLRILACDRSLAVQVEVCRHSVNMGSSGQSVPLGGQYPLTG